MQLYRFFIWYFILDYPDSWYFIELSKVYGMNVKEKGSKLEYTALCILIVVFLKECFS